MVNYLNLEHNVNKSDSRAVKRSPNACRIEFTSDNKEKKKRTYEKKLSLHVSKLQD